LQASALLPVSVCREIGINAQPCASVCGHTLQAAAVLQEDCGSSTSTELRLLVGGAGSCAAAEWHLEAKPPHVSRRMVAA
jgi:hypothetical protein